jgi:hypothetical protein
MLQPVMNALILIIKSRTVNEPRSMAWHSMMPNHTSSGRFSHDPEVG